MERYYLRQQQSTAGTIRKCEMIHQLRLIRHKIFRLRRRYKNGFPTSSSRPIRLKYPTSHSQLPILPLKMFLRVNRGTAGRGSKTILPHLARMGSLSLPAEPSRAHQQHPTISYSLRPKTLFLRPTGGPYPRLLALLRRLQ